MQEVLTSYCPVCKITLIYLFIRQMVMGIELFLRSVLGINILISRATKLYVSHII